MRKTLSIMLAAALVLSLSVPAFAATNKITGVNSPFASDDYTDLSIGPGKVIEIPLTADIFDWSEDAGGSDEAVSINQLNTGKITLKVTNDANSKKIVDKVEFKAKASSATGGDKTAHVRIEFVEEYTSTKELEFEFTVYLARGSNRVKDSAVTFAGTFKNTVLIVDDDEEDYLDISGGQVIETENYIKSIDLHLGEGLYVNTKLYEGREYYGKAVKGVKEDDYKVVDAYPEIDTIYTLTTVNLSSGKVYFDLDDKFYVYDEDGKYVGTTEDQLKYSNKFYLASTKINLSGSSSKNDVEEEDDEGDDVEEVIPVEDDDDYYHYGSGNINDNPGTGIGGILRIAAMLALVSASAVALCAGTKRR